jgi:hypothetical protein
MSSLSTSKYLHYIGLMSKQERQHDDDIQSNVLPTLIAREVKLRSLSVVSMATLITGVGGPLHFDQDLDPMVHQKPPVVMQCLSRCDNPPALLLF